MLLSYRQRGGALRAKARRQRLQKFIGNGALHGLQLMRSNRCVHDSLELLKGSKEYHSVSARMTRIYTCLLPVSLSAGCLVRAEEHCLDMRSLAVFGGAMRHCCTCAAKVSAESRMTLITSKGVLR